AARPAVPEHDAADDRPRQRVPPRRRPREARAPRREDRRRSVVLVLQVALLPGPGVARFARPGVVPATLEVRGVEAVEDRPAGRVSDRGAFPPARLDVPRTGAA